MKHFRLLDMLLISQHLRKYNGHQTPVSISCTTLPQEIIRSEKQYLALPKMRVDLHVTTLLVSFYFKYSLTALKTSLRDMQENLRILRYQIT